MKQLFLLSLIAMVGCKAGGGGNNGDDGTGDDTPGIDAPIVIPDAPPPPEGYTRLLGRTWTLGPGQLDTYRCVRFTVPEDMYITNIQAQAPTGTHHTVLSIAGSNGTSGPDGEQDCSVGTLGMVMLYASGVGTSPLDFPSGVGIKVTKGQQVHLNLHLFNATDKTIAGDSAILVKSQPTPPPMLAEMVFAGKFFFGIPKDAMNYPVEGGCTAPSAFTLFGVWPHQHKLGIKHTLEITHGSTTTKVYEGAYDFNEQNYYLKSPMVQVAQGDTIKVTCRYNNTAGRLVTFGESSNDEMCFSGLYRYPAANAGLFQCTDNPGF